MTTMMLTHDQFKQLQYQLDDGQSLRAYYSGRGMYGRTCFGLDCDQGGPELLQLELAVLKVAADNSIDTSAEHLIDFDWAVDEIREAMAEIGSPSSDTLGMGTIYYWRGIQVEPGLEDSE